MINKPLQYNTNREQGTVSLEEEKKRVLHYVVIGIFE